jgi:hypothetical protein
MSRDTVPWSHSTPARRERVAQPSLRGDLLLSHDLDDALLPLGLANCYLHKNA